MLHPSDKARDFNPRSREGSDHILFLFLPHQTISIHAPARGATLHNQELCRSRKFQSTLPRGERLFLRIHAGKAIKFQSTLPRGERPCRNRETQKTHAFQSTLPRGERPATFYGSNVFRIFQSTLPRGERRLPHGCNVICLCISIHAPARGATLRRWFQKLQMVVFQSTLPRGERPVVGVRFGLKWIFQSTLPRGERQSCKNFPQCIYHFNPRSREGSDI